MCEYPETCSNKLKKRNHNTMVLGKKEITMHQTLKAMVKAQLSGPTGPAKVQMIVNNYYTISNSVLSNIKKRK